MQLRLEDIESIMQTLIYDGKAEKSQVGYFYINETVMLLVLGLGLVLVLIFYSLFNQCSLYVISLFNQYHSMLFHCSINDHVHSMFIQCSTLYILYINESFGLREFSFSISMPFMSFNVKITFLLYHYILVK